MRNEPDPGVPPTMLAAVYRSVGSLDVEEVPVPSVGPTEMLVRIQACGVCGTDLKKIQYGLQAGPRIFGHEMAGVVCNIGADVEHWRIGDRVALFHHVSCGDCFYCDRGLDSQCLEYRQTATTAGFEPAGGGFAEYVLASERAVRRGVVRIPDGITEEEASFIEPVNTCLKGVRRTGAGSGDFVLVFGLGSIGLLLASIADRQGCRVIGVDPSGSRRQTARRLVRFDALEPGTDLTREVRARTSGRGADAAVVATPSVEAIGAAIEAVRPGGRVVLFANTRSPEYAALDVGDLCTRDKEVVGSYSSAMDLVPEAAELVFTRKIPTASFITHRFPLSEIGQAVETAARIEAGVLKVMVRP